MNPANKELPEGAQVDAPKAGFDNEGHVVVKNRAWRRRFKNRAMVEGRRTKHYYTKSQKRKKRK